MTNPLIRLTPALVQSPKLTSNCASWVSTDAEPRGDLCIRTLAMPADTNANGDILAAGC